MDKLPTITCPKCKQAVVSRAYIPPAKSPETINDCLRVCETCEWGFSNGSTTDVEQLAILYRNPFAGIPREIWVGHEEMFAQALNEQSRKKKIGRLSSSNSEDHVTLTVFRYLELRSELKNCLSRAGIPLAQHGKEEPTLLLWGVPVPPTDEKGKGVHAKVVQILKQIGEEPSRRSEPDVILDCGPAGVIVIEVKLRSPNDYQVADQRWDKYLTHSDSMPAAFRDVEAARKSGCYELVRNWRIAWSLANERPLTLINLIPQKLLHDRKNREHIQQFAQSLSQTEGRTFTEITWEAFLKAMGKTEDWFKTYCKERLRYVIPTQDIV